MLPVVHVEVLELAFSLILIVCLRQVSCNSSIQVKPVQILRKITIIDHSHLILSLKLLADLCISAMLLPAVHNFVHAIF